MKKVLTLLPVIALAASLLAACGGGGGGGAKTTTAAVASDSEISSAPVEWTYMIAEFVNAPTNAEQLAYTEMAKKFNVTFKFDVVNGADFTTKLNLAVASDTPPNMICAGTTALTKYYNTGVIVELSPYIEKYGKDYLAEVGKSSLAVKNAKDDDGRQFFFPRIYWDYEYVYMAMDKDFLDEVGMEIPKTTDEFAEALKAIHQLHPDVTYTRGQWNGGTHSLQSPIYSAYGTGERWVHFKEGEYLFGPYERKDEMKAAVKYLNELYEAGAIDPEFLTIDNDAYTAKSVAKKVAAVFGWMGGAHMWPPDENGRPLPDSEYNWKVVPALKGPEGHQYAGVMSLCDQGTYITKSHPDPARATAFWNWAYTAEGIAFRNWGVEGKTYEVVDGKKRYKDEIWADPLGCMNGLRNMGFYPAIDTFVSDFEAYKSMNIPETMAIGIEGNRPYRMAAVPVLTGTDEENDVIAQIGVDILSLIDERLPKFVTGELDVDKDYDAYIAQLENMNIKKYVETNKAMYTRWQNR